MRPAFTWAPPPLMRAMRGGRGGLEGGWESNQLIRCTALFNLALVQLEQGVE